MRSQKSVVKLIPRQLVRGPKRRNLRPEVALFSLEPLGLGFARAQRQEEVLHQRRHGGIPLRCNHAGTAVGVIIK